ncbi:ABC-three component system protein [Gimesia sp.]|uniref:ABC-three component system protein n=1 Tax=Gimesia sp. TaxID=2024833 RepID=UPI003A92185A
MTKSRKKYNEPEKVTLLSQVNSNCPLCNKRLYYEKRNKTYNKYQLAHIYPLNPTTEEIELLEGVEKLSDDDNHIDNIIPLCNECHLMFDKPRTLKEYEQLLEIKKNLISKTGQQNLWHQYQLKKDLRNIIESLYTSDLTLEEGLEYETKEVERKVNASMSILTKRKIKANVAEYYLFIKKQFALMDKGSPDTSTLIASQVKTYYLVLKHTFETQQEIFENIVEWIYVKTKPESIEAAEILSSFYVQSCEVFE